MAAFSQENQSFFRLYFVLSEFGTKTLNEVLRHVIYRTFSPAMTLSDFLALPQVQTELCPTTRRSCIDPMQKELLYPSGIPSTTLDYGDLDITLVTTLLKNLTVFSGILVQPGSSPGTLWTNPTERDQLFHPLEANIVLLKNKRNAMAHSRKPALPARAFQDDFDEVKSLVKNLMGLLGLAFDEDDLELYRNRPLEYRTARVFLDCWEASANIKDEVRRLRDDLTQVESRLSVVDQIRRMMIVFVSMITSIISGFIIGLVYVWEKVTSVEKRYRQLESMIKECKEKVNELWNKEKSDTSEEIKAKGKIAYLKDLPQ